MKKHLNVKTVTASIIVLTLGSLFLLWANGYFGLWINGIKHLAHDPENTYHASVPLDEGYTVNIDLKDLEGNIGKILLMGKQGSIFMFLMFWNIRRVDTKLFSDQKAELIWIRQF